MDEPPPIKSTGMLFRSGEESIRYVQRFTPATAGLKLLGAGEFLLSAKARSGGTSFPSRESLLFQIQGQGIVRVEGKSYLMNPYDTLYVPSGVEFSLSNPSDSPARIFQAAAPAEQLHPVCHRRFSDIRSRNDRIHQANGYDTYFLFDAGDEADKLVASYSIFRPYSRSWPSRAYPDQEWGCVFLKGRGAVEVFESPETLTFVHSVVEGDVVTVPVLHHHPVFTQQESLEILWFGAGERHLEAPPANALSHH